MPLLPGDQDAAALRRGDLHGADAGTGGHPGHGLHRQSAYPRDLHDPVQAVIVGQERILSIDVPTSPQGVLLVPEQNPTVGEIRV